MYTAEYRRPDRVLEQHPRMDVSLINVARTAPSERQKSVLVALLNIGWAVFFQVLVSLGSAVVAFVLLGRSTDEVTLAAYSLGNTICNLCGRFIVLGVACALDTLASQANGAGEFRKVGLYFQRSVLILLVLVCAPLTAVWWFASPILVALHQPRAVADQVSLFARICLPGLYAQAIYVAGSKIFLAMGKSRPVMLSALFGEVTIISLLILLIVHPLHLGLRGAAIATVASNIVQPTTLLLFALADKDLRACWPGVTRGCLRGWCSYLKLGAPACFMLLAEALSWDIVSFLTGLCDTATGRYADDPKTLLAAQGLLQSTIALCYCVPQAISRAGATVVGNAVGAGDATRAAHAARVCLWLGLATSAALIAALAGARHQIVMVYGAPQPVSEIVQTMIPLLSGFLFCDCMQMNLTGVITGAGKQRVTGPILVVAYFVLGLPVGATAAFHPLWGHKRLGLLGLWLGMTLAVVIHSSSYLLVCFGGRCSSLGIRWDCVLKDAQRRLEEEEGPASPAPVTSVAS